jgi:hypothetical protein
MLNSNGRENPFRPPTSLWFLDHKTIIGSSVSGQCKRVLLERDTCDLGLPLQLHAVVLDAATGKILSASAWPVTSYADRQHPETSSFTDRRHCLQLNAKNGRL